MKQRLDDALPLRYSNEFECSVETIGFGLFGAAVHVASSDHISAHCRGVALSAHLLAVTRCTTLNALARNNLVCAQNHPYETMSDVVRVAFLLVVRSRRRRTSCSRICKLAAH